MLYHLHIPSYILRTFTEVFEIKETHVWYLIYFQHIVVSRGRTIGCKVTDFIYYTLVLI